MKYKIYKSVLYQNIREFHRGKLKKQMARDVNSIVLHLNQQETKDRN